MKLHWAPEEPADDSFPINESNRAAGAPKLCKGRPSSPALANPCGFGKPGYMYPAAVSERIFSTAIKNIEVITSRVHRGGQP
jgi:hypothetical protein